MTSRLLIVVAVAAFAVNLLWCAPAEIVYGWIMPADAAVSAAGISGTLGHGRLAALLVRGQPALENLSWRWSPAWLLLGRLRLNLQGGGSDLNIQGGLQESFGGVSLHDTTLTGNLSKLIALSPVVFAPVSGLVDAHIDRARWHHDALVELDGVINAQRVHWTLAQPPFLLGDYVAHLTTVDGGVDAQLSSPSGPLMLSGNAHLATDSRAYSLDVLLHAEGAVNPLLQNLLHSLGQPDPQGRYHIQSRGALGPASGQSGAVAAGALPPQPATLQALPTPPVQVAPAAAPSFAPAPAGAGPSPQSIDANSAVEPPPPNDEAPPDQALPPPEPPPPGNLNGPGAMRRHRLGRPGEN